jgi:hypothetical protein
MDYEPKIVAKKREDFDTIKKLLDTLHPSVLNQIEQAEKGPVGLDCYIRNTYSDSQEILVPVGVTQISHFGDYIGIYCGKYFFRIVIPEDDKRKFSYVFGYEYQTAEDKNEN